MDGVEQSSSGLTSAQAAQRLAQDGPNSLPQGALRTWRLIFLDTLQEPMFGLLLAASVLYLLLGELQEGLVLVGLVSVILGLTFYQEGKTEKALQALRDLSSPRARVLRDGLWQTLAGPDLVAGDVLLLGEGDRVPADLQIMTAHELLVDESLLTGESVPVVPQAYLHAGTLLVRGHATARVTATGPRSQLGRIGGALVELQPLSSPLRQQTARLVRRLAWLGVVLSLVLFVLQGLSHGQWGQALLSAIALTMAMLPQEFTVVLTVLPALGAWRLSRAQVLTRRITAIETLGAVSVLCVDKTGTLTHNRMAVSELYAQGQHWPLQVQPTHELPETFHPLLEYAILASETKPLDPMEQAFAALGQSSLHDTEHLHQDWTLAHAYPLTPELRAMARVWRSTDGDLHAVAAKGSPEAIADLCHLSAAQRAALAQDADAMARRGLRVLGVARSSFRGPPWPERSHDFAFELLGLVGLSDPLREEIPAALRECRSAGIRVLMITGDYPLTAQAIAAQAGWPDVGVLTGDEMDRLDDMALQRRLADIQVCARIAPAQKLRIVQALQAGGAVVGMTGDGVNDAPALRAAHVGVAMGGRGTDVAREAASLVLLDDNFASIVRAVRLGRRIFDNLRKSMAYILAVHVPIAGLALFPPLLGWPMLLYPMHIAFLELVIDPACSIVFENEPADGRTMQRPPRDPARPLFSGRDMVWALFQGLGVLLAVLVAYAWGRDSLPEPVARALSFSVLVLCNLALLWSNRGADASFGRSMLRPNRVLWSVTLGTLALLGSVLYVPGLADLMHLAPLPAQLWALVLAAAGLSLLWCELLRRLRQHVNGL